MSQPETSGQQAALGSKQLVFVWLFGGLIEWTIQYLNRWLSPSTAADYLPFEAVAGGVCAVIYVWLKWPRVFTLSRIKPRVSDLAVGVPLGYLATSITAVIVGKAAFRSDPMIVHPARKLIFVCAVLIVPVVEELIYRGAILSSLSQRLSMLSAVAITVVAAAAMHDDWRMAVPDQVLLCAAYLIQRRSIPASIIAHAVANALIFAPSLLVTFHMALT